MSDDFVPRFPYVEMNHKSPFSADSDLHRQYLARCKWYIGEGLNLLAGHWAKMLVHELRVTR